MSYSYDRRVDCRIAAGFGMGTLKSREVLELNEDVNDAQRAIKKIADKLTQVYSKLRDEEEVSRKELHPHDPHVRQEGITKLAAALRAVDEASDKTEAASRALNYAAQYFET